ncbi:hypothetical protein JNUCC74_03435 [Cerasibacillus sp. JNUCC 74]
MFDISRIEKETILIRITLGFIMLLSILGIIYLSHREENINEDIREAFNVKENAFIIEDTKTMNVKKVFLDNQQYKVEVDFWGDIKTKIKINDE